MKKILLLSAILSFSLSTIAQEKESKEIDWEAFRLTVRKASEEAVKETNEKLSQTSRYEVLFREADSVFHVQHICPCEKLKINAIDHP